MRSEYLVVSPHQLGQVSRGVRKSKGLTQEELASRVGLRQKTVSLFETDPGHTSIERLFQMLAALELELVVREKKPVPGFSPEAEW